MKYKKLLGTIACVLLLNFSVAMLSDPIQNMTFAEQTESTESSLEAPQDTNPSSSITTIGDTTESFTQTILSEDETEKKVQDQENGIKLRSSLKATETDEEVSIPDVALRSFILQSLGKNEGDPILKSEMGTIKSLMINGTGASSITNLEGLQYAIGLTTLYIKIDQVTDFSILNSLTQLTSLSLYSKNLVATNVPDIEKFTELTMLYLGDSGKLDNSVVEKVARLSKLERVYLDSNQGITSVTSFTALKELRSLSIQFCGVADFSFVNQMESLTDLAAFGQNTGRYDVPTKVYSSRLAYDSEKETLFLPFSMMPNRLTNYDGYTPPFTISSSPSSMYLDFNGGQLPESRLAVDETGITVKNVTPEEFTKLESFKYNVRLNSPVGSYATPEGFNFYSISSGTYLHKFVVSHDPEPSGVLRIQYLDAENQELLPLEEYSGTVDEDYHFSAKEIQGYKLKETIGNPVGKYTREDEQITFVYQKEPSIKDGIVRVIHQSKSGETLQTEEFKGQVGKSYKVESKKINGYTYIGVGRGTLTGVFTEEEQEIVLLYENEGTVPTTETSTDPSKIKDSSTANESSSKSATNQSLPNTNSNEENKLPQTGENLSVGLSIVGIGLVLMAGFYLRSIAKQDN